MRPQTTQMSADECYRTERCLSYPSVINLTYVEAIPKTMSVRKGSSILGLIAFCLLGCQVAEPTIDEVTGFWTNSDGATLGLFAGGYLEADSLPTALFIPMRDDPPLCKGSGKWSIKEDQGSWKVELQFDELSCYNGTAFSSLIIDTEGAGIVLFKWKGEEGGARYEMRRMISR